MKDVIKKVLREQSGNNEQEDIKEFLLLNFPSIINVTFSDPYGVLTYGDNEKKTTQRIDINVVLDPRNILKGYQARSTRNSYEYPPRKTVESIRKDLNAFLGIDVLGFGSKYNLRGYELSVEPVN